MGGAVRAMLAGVEVVGGEEEARVAALAGPALELGWWSGGLAPGCATAALSMRAAAAWGARDDGEDGGGDDDGAGAEAEGTVCSSAETTESPSRSGHMAAIWRTGRWRPPGGRPRDDVATGSSPPNTSQRGHRRFHVCLSLSSAGYKWPLNPSAVAVLPRNGFIRPRRNISLAARDNHLIVPRPPEAPPKGPRRTVLAAPRLDAIAHTPA